MRKAQLSVSVTERESCWRNLMKRAIKNILGIGFLLVLLALPLVVSGCGTKKADLSITNTVDKTTVNVGDTVNYTVTLTNTGSVNGTGITVTDALPLGVTYVSSDAGQGSYDDSTGIWNVGNQDSKASAKLTITADVAAKAGVRIIDNLATLTHIDQPDVNSNNTVASSSITVNDTDLQVTIAVDNATPNEKDTITYSISLTNNGPVNATGVTVYDALPNGVTYVSSTASQGSYDPGTGDWTVGDIDNGAQSTLTIKATVNTGTGALAIDNSTQIIYADQPDSNLNNNSVKASLTVNGAELDLTNSVDTVTPSEGGTVTYYVTVTNNGPLKATGIVITDILPAGVTYTSSTADQGTYDTSTGIWTVGDITNAASSTLTIKVTVNTGTSKQKITSHAAITHADQPDGTPENNTGATTITVQ